ncbi:MAG: class I SAM-dependent methyltransferase [Gaiellales bacterium]
MPRAARHAPRRWLAAAADRAFVAGYARLVGAESDAMRSWRRWVAGRAHGTVLELGAGTGANLPLYDRAAVERLVLVEPSPAMRRRLAPAAARWGAELVDADADHLPLPDQTADAVVATLVLCSVPDPAAALAEIRRVLRPGGRLLLLEHVRAHDAAAAAWQDRLDLVWRHLAQGCHPNRDTAASVRAAGFRVEEEHPVPVDMPGARLFPHLALVAAR